LLGRSLFGYSCRVTTAANPPSFTRRQVLDAVQRYWGFDALRPIQERAIRAALHARDSLVVMPTGGGKSLCFQVPPLVTGRLSVVVSPLISLMKDQVDGLVLSGYPAATLNSGMDAADARRVEAALGAGELRLLYLAPERLLTGGMLERLGGLDVGAFAIDEAHCISQWGHDFRPEYRRLAELRGRFPGAAIHAFTATATQRVREDIAAQLRLRQPEVLVGVFDRPNLTYRVLPRVRADEQIADAVERHASGEHAGATIVYCISRKDTESLAAVLGARGIRAQAYHAGLEPAARRRVQDDFAAERLNVVVATVAFGMGIDRSDVRCVIHAAMPKSIEAYQQETGRAGRDGLPAECLLLYSAADQVRWLDLIRRSAEEAGASEESVRNQHALLDQMHRLAAGAACRHKALSEYFGQAYSPPAGGSGQDGAAAGCGACDVCLGDLAPVPDSTAIARKIASCVFRVGQNFGAAHVADVLRGANTQRILDRRHDQLSTFGLLRGSSKALILGYINQLIDQGVLARTEGEYPVIVLAGLAAELLKGQREIALLQPKRDLTAAPERSRASEGPLSAEESKVFDALRGLRIAIARERGLPPYILFHDTVLRELARRRPTSVEGMAGVPGVGARKLADLGPRFVAFIAERCRELGLPADLPATQAPAERERGSRGGTTGSRSRYFEQFDRGRSIAEAADAVGHRPSTACGYLVEYIAERKPRSLDAWVSRDVYTLVAEAAAALAAERVGPLYEHLAGRATYEEIRIVMAHQRATHGG